MFPAFADTYVAESYEYIASYDAGEDDLEDYNYEADGYIPECDTGEYVPGVPDYDDSMSGDDYIADEDEIDDIADAAAAPVALGQMVDSWEALREAINVAPANVPVTIEIAGSFAAPAGAPGNVIVIPADRQITLISTENTERVLTQTNARQRHFDVLGSLSLGQSITLSGGAVNNTNDSGGVDVRSGTLTMNEGSVIENAHRQNHATGGAVMVHGSAAAFGTFNLNGGTIRNNSAFQGGGVAQGSDNSRINMSGGSITGNMASGHGGGVFAGGQLGGTIASGLGFYMTGGSITNNTADIGGGISDGGINHRPVILVGEYSGLYIGANTVFYGNTAGRGASAPPDVRPSNIATTSASIWDHALNNYDINFMGWLGQTPDQRAIDSWERLRWAVNNAPANVPTTLEIAESFAAGGSGSLLDGAEIEIPVDRDIALVGTGAERVLTQTRNHQRHFVVYGSLTLEQNITLRGNAAGIAISSGGVELRGATLTMNEGSVIENCRRQGGAGGAVSLTGGSTFDMNGGTIRNNVASSGGGVRIAGNSRMNMNSGSITGNEARDDGGGVFVHSSAGPIADGYGFYMTGGSITNNTANVGGGISSWRASSFVVVPVTSYNDLFIGEGAIFYGNTAGLGASAPPDNRLPHIATTPTSIWDYALNNYDISYTGRLDQMPEPTNPVVDSWVGLREAIDAAPANVPVTIEIANSFAAPIEEPHGSRITIPADRQITLVSTDTEPGYYNVRTLTQTRSQRNFAWGHFWVSGSLTLEQNITLSGSVENGTNRFGGVFVEGRGTFTMNEGSMIENCGDSAVVVHGNMGAGESNRATFYMNGGTIRNNSGANGGGVNVSGNSHMNMSGGSIENNTASTRGGGIHKTAGSVNISGGVITGNTAPQGGGINLHGGSTLVITGGSITNNTATAGNGGGIFTHAIDQMNSVYVPSWAYNNLHIGEDVIFYGNTASNGASLPPVNRLPNIAITSTSIWDYALNNYDINFTALLGSTPDLINSWQMLRRAVYAAPANVPTTIEIASSFAAEGRSHSMPGAVILIPQDRQIKLVSTGAERVLTQTGTHDRHFHVQGSLTLGQNITLSGGAENNTNSSGGVNIVPSGTFTMNEGSVIENCRFITGISGGAVSLNGGSELNRATFYMNGGTIQNNTAFHGAGVDVHAGGRVYMSGGSITGNVASGQGGAIHLRTGAWERTVNSTFTMTGGSITNNTAAGDGGGIWSKWSNNSLTLPADAYNDLYVGANAIFYGNTSGRGASAPPDNRLPHIATISASIWDSPLNNYDINFTGRLGQTP